MEGREFRQVVDGTRTHSDGNGIGPLQEIRKAFDVLPFGMKLWFVKDVWLVLGDSGCCQKGVDLLSSHSPCGGVGYDDGSLAGKLFLEQLSDAGNDSLAQEQSLGL